MTIQLGPTSWCFCSQFTTWWHRRVPWFKQDITVHIRYVQRVHGTNRTLQLTRNVLWNGVDNLTYRANTSTFIADTFILIPAINVSTRHAELASIAHWAQANNLTLNIAKSQEILFSDKRRKWKILCTHWNSRTQAGANYQNPWHHCYQWPFGITACSQCYSIMRPNTLCLACSPHHKLYTELLWLLSSHTHLSLG